MVRGCYGTAKFATTIPARTVLILSIIPGHIPGKIDSTFCGNEGRGQEVSNDRIGWQYMNSSSRIRSRPFAPGTDDAAAVFRPGTGGRSGPPHDRRTKHV